MLKRPFHRCLGHGLPQWDQPASCFGRPPSGCECSRLWRKVHCLSFRWPNNQSLEDLRLWVCSNTKRTQTRNCLFAISRAPCRQRKFRQHHSVWLLVGMNGCVFINLVINDYRLWDIEFGTCLRILEGHDELVRCIRVDNKRIVSGAYDGWVLLSLNLLFFQCLMRFYRKIKVWDLTAALDPRSPAGTLCLRTLVEHTGRVFRLQFDDFQIVSSSHDDTILIWDFLNPEVNQCDW